jgi:hypothetical protein
MDLTRLTLGERIVLVAGVLLIIDLLFLPWHSVSVLGVHLTRTGVQSPNAGYGVLALLLVIVMVGQIIAAKMTSAKLPDPPVPWSQIHLIAGVAVAVLLVLKLLVETNILGLGSYLGVALGLAVAYGGYTIRQEDSILV